ncbi:MAG: penicillin-binding protein [Deferrisomatales bacterium]
MSSPGPRRATSDRRARRRVALLAVPVLGLFAAAAVRAVMLQVYRAPELKARADDQSLRRIQLLPERGTLYDRNGRQLAYSLQGGSVFADPSALAEAPAEFERVCRTLDLDPVEARRQLARSGSRFAWLKRGVTPREEEAVRALGLAGVGVTREPRRYYPKKALAGQVLGFVGLDGEGLGGLEYRFDSLLRGKARSVRAQRDARGGFLLSDAPDLAGSKGRSLVLTLDETIQHIAEEELQRVYEQSQARSATAVVLDPTTGEVLALAQVPAFNPNAVAAMPGGERKIKAVVDVYEPGSVLKAMFLGILLDRGLAKPAERVFCENGAWGVHGRTIHDHVPHGWLTVAEVLKVSSNIGVAKLSERLSKEELHDRYAAFGLGRPTGIELPGESRGILPPTRTWSKITAKTLSYGQGISTTAVQVAAAMGAVANRGVLLRPRLVRAVLDEDGRVAERFEPEVVGQPLTAQTAETLTRMMEDVVQAEGGTAGRAAVPGYTVAGKTGTSWKPNPETGGYHRNKVVASFAGFAPSRGPRIAVLVAVDEPSKGSRYGGMVAGPGFREMARRILAYLQVPPEADGSVAAAARGPEGDRPRRAQEIAADGAMPDLSGLTMREALRRVEASGVEVNLRLLGSGVATTQDPSPGTRLEPGQECRVLFKPLM